MPTQEPSFNAVRVENNLKALWALKHKTSRLDLLNQYSGWGGLREAVYTPSIYRQMKRFLSDAEILSIKQTLKTGYQTPKVLVQFIYQALEKLNCQPKRILEPSAGKGIFLDYLPRVWQQNANITAIDLDSVSCRFLGALYPDVMVCHQGFETFRTDHQFDLVIGNPPFGQMFVEDKVYPDLSIHSITHYFVAKSMRLLNDNGMLAMVVPRYFMDNPRREVRSIIAKEGGELVAAFRLPDDLFEDAAVTIDVIFLKKFITKPVPQHSRWIQSRCVENGKNKAYLNEYFFDHRDHVLGKLKFFPFKGRTEITCKRNEANFGDLLQSRLPEFDWLSRLYDESTSGLNIGHLLQKYRTFAQNKINAIAKNYERLDTPKTRRLAKAVLTA